MTLSATETMQRTIAAPPVMRRTKLPDTAKIETDLYLSMQKILCHITNDICKLVGLDFEEMKLQADLLFVKALRRFDDEREIKFTSFCYSVVRNGLIDYGRGLRKHDDWAHRASNSFIDSEGEEQSIFDRMVDPTASRYYGLMDDLNDLSPAANELADLALAGMASSKKDIQTLAVKRLGYTNEQVDLAFADLTEMVDGWQQ